KESYKLQMDLNNLMKDGSEESKETASQLNKIFKERSSYSYGDNGMLSTLWSECPLLENGTLTTTVDNGMLSTLWSECPLYLLSAGHRDTFCDVNVFWNKIELNRRLQDQLQTAEVIVYLFLQQMFPQKPLQQQLETFIQLSKNVNDAL
ncbi:4484_t:CDS:2, partial [Acaulospora colombiana]